MTSQYLTSVKTYIISPKVRIRAPKHSLVFRQARSEDLAKVLAFVNGEGRKKDLFPVIDSPDQFFNLHTEDFYILLDGDEIVSCAALWDVTGYKQFIVKKYGGLMRAARIANPLLSALGYVKLPRENVPLAFPVLSFFVTKEDSEEFFYIFLNEIRKEISKRYDMYVLDLPEGHFAGNVLDRKPHVSFLRLIYQLQFPWSGQEYKKVDPQKLRTESSLL